MENQIKKCLLTLRKIGNLPDNPYIDTTEGDIDMYQPGVYNYAKHVIFDGRSRMRSLLDKKYEEISLLVTTMIEGNKHTEYLEIIYQLLDTSKVGLKLIDQSKFYQDDMKVHNKIEHIADVEIPIQMGMIDEYCKKHGKELSLLRTGGDPVSYPQPVRNANSKKDR